ncbi:hypothetical protein Salmuc_00741 [Salipiger mucosus DSM 16094]|uniref:Uncharacterized protein n=1 Tax=Salipiger mucosus DSM 16094 TaxID=1123237 RepID=S9Q932_9RHOB|nr:hypothetical protein Salmuc_00741 [Salipiger mucosus DSM 16094]
MLCQLLEVHRGVQSASGPSSLTLKDSRGEDLFQSAVKSCSAAFFPVVFLAGAD